MKEINVKRFGLAVGGSLALLYLICILIIIIFGPSPIAYLVTVLFHGIEMTSVVSREVPFWMGVGGIIEVFVLGGITGMLAAGIYNWATKRNF